MKNFAEWLINIMTWCSQTVNVWFLFGNPDQSISSRAYTSNSDPKWDKVRKTINIVFFWQEDHCLSAYKRDVKNAKKLLGIG